MELKPTMPIRGVILDWAGTTIDFGSLAPTWVFMEIFRQRGVEITSAEARGPMGRGKLDHIATIAAMSRVRNAWLEHHGQAPSQDDIQAMYTEFLPLQTQMLAKKSDMIPGVVEAIKKLRGRGLKIGSSTGYTLELMRVVSKLAAEQGYAPDATVCADEVPAGRPAPWMNFLCAQRLGIYPMSSMVVVDDTAVGIEAAKNAGAIAVAVSKTGNALGLSYEQTQALSQQELDARLKLIEIEFLELGADVVLESVAELPELIDRLSGQV